MKTSPTSTAPLLARNALLNLAGQVAPRLVALVAIPFIIRGLGAEGYGILSLALIVLGYIGLFDLGLGRATTKFVAGYLGRKETTQLPGLVWTSLALQLLLGTLAGLLLAAGSSFLVSKLFTIPPQRLAEANATLRLLGAALPIVLASATLQGLLAAMQRFDLVNAVAIPVHAANFLIPAVGASFGLRVPEIVFLLVLTRLGGALVYGALCLKIFPPLRQRPLLEFKLLRQLVTYGSWVTISTVLGPLLLYSDRFLIAGLLSMTAVAYYTTAFQLGSALWVLPVSLVGALFPALTSLDAAGGRQELQKLYARALKALLLTVGPLVLLLVLFANTILSLWVGPSFAQHSSVPLRVLALGVLASSLGCLPAQLFQAVGRPDVPAKFNLIELPIYLLGLWLLVGKLGIAGAALAWTLLMVLDAALLFAACSLLKVVPLRAVAQNGFWRSVAVVAGLALTLSLTLLAGRGSLTQSCLAAVVIGLFALTTWRYGLDRADKSFLTSLIGRLAIAVKGHA